MAELEFKDFTFIKEQNRVKVTFLKIFYFYLSKNELNAIDEFGIKGNKIIFKAVSQAKAEKKFNQLLLKGFSGLKNPINGRKAVYVHRNSGIPLIGTIYFGIVDKGSDMIELKPITGCNLNCIFCSVGEGERKDLVDFVVEEEYLIEETKKLLDTKKGKVDVYINPHGEPLLYGDLTQLIKDLRKIKSVKKIILITNGTLLTENKIDELIKAGLDSFNLSINALSQEKTEKLAGTGAISAKKLKETCRYIAKKNKLVLTPVLLSGLNEDELIALGKFAGEIQAKVITQNYLSCKRGKKPVKELSFEEFYLLMNEFARQNKIKLVEPLPKTRQTKELPIPFKKEQVIEAEIVCKGRHKSEIIAAAKARAITAVNCKKNFGKVRIKLARSMHNVFFGECVK